MKFFAVFFFCIGILTAFGQTDQNLYQQARQVLREHKARFYSQFEQLRKTAFNDRSNRTEFDARYYRIEIATDYIGRAITGKVTARFSARSTLDSIVLDMDENLQVSEVGGSASNFNHRNQFLTLYLNRTYQEGDTLTVSITYAGNPTNGGEAYFNFDELPDGSPHIWTLSEPYGARYWWPCKDSPADKADSIDILITVPKDQIAASIGTLRSVEENPIGTRTWHWHEQYPITTYLVSLAIARYDHFQDTYNSGDTLSMLLDYYVYPDKGELARELFQEMHDYLDCLSYYFGPYPFLKEKYGHAQFGWGGAMEHQTLTSIGNVSQYWRYIYVHELGHQWFGDMVTCASWTDIWLNEGFASYSEALYAEWAGYGGYPPGAEAYHAYINSQEYFEDGTIHIADTSAVSNIFDRIVYDKGSWVLHMLRHVLGDSVFFDVLKSYLSDPRWQYGSARTADFRGVCEAKSGLDLKKFFDQWLYYPYYPEYEYEWSVLRRESGQYITEVKIRQTQQTTVYEMPVDLTFRLADGQDTTIVVNNNSFYQQYTINLSAQPEQMWFDRDNWILKKAFEAPTEKYSDEIRVSRAFPNPFNETITLRLINFTFEPCDLLVFDVRGRIVKRLQPTRISRYNHDYVWDGRNESGQIVANGVYFIRAQRSANTINLDDETAKIIFLK